MDKEWDAGDQADEADAELSDPNPVVGVPVDIFRDRHWEGDNSRAADDKEQGRGAVHDNNHPTAEFDPISELIVWPALEPVELSYLLEAVGQHADHDSLEDAQAPEELLAQLP